MKIVFEHCAKYIFGRVIYSLCKQFTRALARARTIACMKQKGLIDLFFLLLLHENLMARTVAEIYHARQRNQPHKANFPVWLCNVPSLL